MFWQALSKQSSQEAHSLQACGAQTRLGPSLLSVDDFSLNISMMVSRSKFTVQTGLMQPTALYSGKLWASPSPWPEPVFFSGNGRRARVQPSFVVLIVDTS